MNSRAIKRVLRHRFVVTLRASEGVFSGVLTTADHDVFVLEDCATIPGGPDGTPDPIRGRVFVDRRNVAYLQEISP